MSYKAFDKTMTFKNALLSSAKNEKFYDFINSLTEEELITYFYIEAKRIKFYLEELGLKDTTEKEENIENKNHRIIKSQKEFEFIEEFCKTYSSLSKLKKECRNNVIIKHELYFKKLTDGEKEFFREC